MIDRSLNRLRKKSRRGMRGYPMRTVAYFGPDNSRATKLAAGVLIVADAEAEIRTWFSETGDVRVDAAIAAEVLAFFETRGVLTVSIAERMLGCPHQEGIDYDGQYCPVCVYWIGRDRFTGIRL